MSKPKTRARRRPGGHITLGRAARLHRLVMLLSSEPMSRPALLASLAIGLRTFYRELELLKKCGIRLKLDENHYTLKTTKSEAEGRLPFPDPQLSFAEMAELSSQSGPAASRLAALLATVVGTQLKPAKKRATRR
jgi:predicted DNA-binding transcriptional regulator YafY